MFTPLFSSNTLWLVALAIVATGAIFRLRRERAAATNPDEPLLTKFDALHAAILADTVSEASFAAWAEHVPHRHPQNRSTAQTSALLACRTGLQEAMRHRGWKRQTISGFINTFWHITTEDIDALLTKR